MLKDMKGIQYQFRNLFPGEFYRNIAGLFTGIFAARLIPALFAFLIARLYLPDQFGEFVLYFSIASLLSVFVNGGYEGAVILAESDAQRHRIFRLSLRNNLIINLIASAGIFGFMALWGKNDTWNILLMLVPFYAFFFGGLQMIRNYFISHQNFRKLAWLEITRALLTGILQSLFFILPETGLFLGVVLAQMVTFLIFSSGIKFTSGFRLFHWSSFELALARRYRNFPLYSLPAEFFNYLSQQLPVFLIKPFFGSVNLGLYSFSHRYLSVPVQLTSISIGSVYIERARSLKEKHDSLAGLTWSLFKKQVWISLIPFTVLALWGKPLFGFLFGNEWEYSGLLAQILSPWLFTVFISSPLSTILIAREKQRFSMIFNILLLLSRAIVLVVGGWLLKDLTLTVGLFSITGFVFFVFLGIYSLKLAHVNLVKAGLFCLKMLIICTLPLILLRLWI
jgi:O-antigen/teichoic acid export membrane protein